MRNVLHLAAAAIMAAAVGGCQPAGGPREKPAPINPFNASDNIRARYWPPAQGAGLFQPPPQAKVIYRCDFESGPDGWGGEVVDQGMPLGKRALKAAGAEWVSRKLDFAVDKETVLSFYVYTEDCPLIFLQVDNATIKDNCKSFWPLYPNRDRGKWVHVLWPLNGTLVDCSTNSVRTVQAGDKLTDLQIHYLKGKTVLIDNVVLYSMDAKAKLAEATQRLANSQAVKSVSGGNPPSLFGLRKQRLEQELRRLGGEEDLSWHQAFDLFDQVVRLERTALHARYLSAARTRTMMEFLVGITDPMTRVSDRHWRHPFTGNVLGGPSLSAAANEYVSFQASIIPLNYDMKDVRLSFSNLASTNDKPQIQATTIQWHLQPYVQQRPSHGYCGLDWIGPTSDPLWPGEPFDVAVDSFRTVWVTVRVPPHTQAGAYQGTMTVSHSTGRAQQVPIKLQVRGYDLPRTGRFRCQTHWNIGPINEFYRKPITKDEPWRRQWQGWMLQHRFCPTQQYSTDFTPFIEDIDFCRDHGNNTWILAGMAGSAKMTPAQMHARATEAKAKGEDIVLIPTAYRGQSAAKEVNVGEIRRRYEIAKAKGILPYCHVYIGDETGDFPLMQKTANLIHATFPGLKVMIGGSRPRPELIGYIDIWDPIIEANALYGLNADELRQAQARGEEVMWYVAASPQHPYPNVQMGDPLYASRALFWLTWKYRVTGFEYYCFNLWKDNVKRLPRWPTSPWDTYSFDRCNGDGQLAYPGPDGAPGSSVRIENIRDGIEDWEALYILEGAAELLEKRIAEGKLVSEGGVPPLGPVAPHPPPAEIVRLAKALLTVDDAFAKDVTEWALDPAGLLQRRQQADALIENAIGIVGRGAFDDYQVQRFKDRQALEAKRLEENRQRALRELKANPITLPPATQPATATATRPSAAR